MKKQIENIIKGSLSKDELNKVLWTDRGIATAIQIVDQEISNTIIDYVS